MRGFSRKHLRILQERALSLEKGSRETFGGAIGCWKSRHCRSHHGEGRLYPSRKIYIHAAMWRTWKKIKINLRGTSRLIWQHTLSLRGEKEGIRFSSKGGHEGAITIHMKGARITYHKEKHSPTKILEYESHHPWENWRKCMQMTTPCTHRWDLSTGNSAILMDGSWCNIMSCRVNIWGSLGFYTLVTCWS